MASSSEVNRDPELGAAAAPPGWQLVKVEAPPQNIPESDELLYKLTEDPYNLAYVQFGKNKSHRFVVHKPLLCHYAPFFNLPDSADVLAHIFTLPEEDNSDRQFQEFLTWLYKPTATKNPQPAARSVLKSPWKAWLLAQKLQALDFEIYTFADFLFKVPVASVDRLDRILQDTPVDSAPHRFTIAWLSWNIELGTPLEVVTEVCKSFEKLPQGFDPRMYEMTHWSGLCVLPDAAPCPHVKVELKYGQWRQEPLQPKQTTDRHRLSIKMSFTTNLLVTILVLAFSITILHIHDAGVVSKTIKGFNFVWVFVATLNTMVPILGLFTGYIPIVNGLIISTDAGKCYHLLKSPATPLEHRPTAQACGSLTALAIVLFLSFIIMAIVSPILSRLSDDYYGSYGLISLGGKNDGTSKRSKAYRAEMARLMQAGGTTYRPPVTAEGGQVVSDAVKSAEYNDSPPPYEREEVKKEKEGEAQ